jgi:sugar phosphate isomerase/epimerase
MAKPILGAQLYTVREYVKTIPAIAETLKKVKNIGYTTVQISGFGPVDPKEVAKVVMDSGLKVTGTHVVWNRLLNDLDAVINEHKMWGCRHLAIGGLHSSEYTCADGVKRFVRELLPVAKRLAREGMDFSYHNHNHELARFDGKTWLAALYEQAAPQVLKAEIDTYWIQAGGGDPVEWIRKCAGREPLLHLKDMLVMPDRQIRMAEIGNGNMNWPGILKAAEECGVECMFVEQDECYGRDPFESLAISYEYLKNMGYR